MLTGETTSVRDFTIEGIKFHAECRDPYGFWRVKLDPEGKATKQPEEIAGVWFTSLTEAEKAMTAYVSKKTNKDQAKFKKEVINPDADKE